MKITCILDIFFTGLMLGAIFPMIFYAFIETLPLEFMILEEVHNLFGSYGVFFIGTYSNNNKL